MANQIKNLPIKDWDTLPVPVYNLIITELKERLDDLAIEEGTITDRSIKCMVSFISFLSVIAAVIATKINQANLCLLIIIATLCIINLYLLYQIIKGRESFLKGLNMTDILTTDFDRSDLSEVEKERLMLNNIIMQLQSKIDRIKPLKDKRVEKYNNTFLLTLALIVALSIYVGVLFL